MDSAVSYMVSITITLIYSFVLFYIARHFFNKWRKASSRAKRSLKKLTRMENQQRVLEIIFNNKPNNHLEMARYLSKIISPSGRRVDPFLYQQVAEGLVEVLTEQHFTENRLLKKHRIKIRHINDTEIQKRIMEVLYGSIDVVVGKSPGGTYV